MPCKRATWETVIPGSMVCRIMAIFSCGVLRLRSSCPNSIPVISKLEPVLDICLSLSLILRYIYCLVFLGAAPRNLRTAEPSASPALLSYMKKSLVLLSENKCSTNWRHHRIYLSTNSLLYSIIHSLKTLSALLL